MCIRDRSGDNELLAGNEVTVFFGEGPLYLENKSINPLAKGFIISEAKVGLVRSVGEGGDQHALKASGNISMIGIPEMIIEGKVNLEYNSYDTEVFESIAVSDNEEINIDFANCEVAYVFGAFDLTYPVAFSVLLWHCRRHMQLVLN